MDFKLLLNVLVFVWIVVFILQLLIFVILKVMGEFPSNEIMMKIFTVIKGAIFISLLIIAISLQLISNDLHHAFGSCGIYLSFGVFIDAVLIRFAWPW